MLPIVLLLLAQEADDTPVFRTGSTLAPVRFHVVRDKRFVSDLKPQDIVLLEDGHPRPVTFFEGGPQRRTTPLEVILLFDVSGSVTHLGLLDALLYKAALLDGLPMVRLSVYGFAAKLFKFTGPTRDPEQVAAALTRVKDGPRPKAIPLTLPPKRKHAEGGTWIYEAVLGALRDSLRTPDGATRMMLVFSDGLPTTDSRVEDAAALPAELGVPVYPVALGHRQVQQQLRSARGALRRAKLQDKERDIQEFARLGELTGGRSFEPFEANANAARDIIRYIAAQALFEYVAGFAPEPSTPPRKHKLQVKLADPAGGKVSGGTRTAVY